jgi:S-methylmethionine-dependent homocysteine/selenocysteine methylase
MLEKGFLLLLSTFAYVFLFWEEQGVRVIGSICEVFLEHFHAIKRPLTRR